MCRLASLIDRPKLWPGLQSKSQRVSFMAFLLAHLWLFLGVTGMTELWHILVSNAAESTLNL